MRRAFAYASLEQYLSLALSLGLLLVVSRLLSPEEVGLAAIGAGLATVAFTLRDFASPEFLIQRPDVLDDDLRTSVTLQTLSGAAIAGAFWLAGPWLGQAYSAPGLAQFLSVMCVVGLAESVAAPAQALLRRAMAFASLAKINTSGLVVSATVTIALAAAGHGYMSIAWGQACGALAKAGLTLHQQPGLPFLRPSLASWRSALGFGGYYAGMTLITRAYEAMPQLLLGWMMPLSAVGFYNRATLVAGIPGRFLLTPVYALAMPAFAAHARDGQDLRAAYLRGLSIISVIYCPALAMLAILADPLVALVLGTGWQTVVPVVRILAIGAITLFPTVLTGPMLISAGGIRHAFANSVVARGSGAVIIAAASFHGLVGLALGQLVAYQVGSFVAARAAKRHLGFAWRDFAVALRASVCITGCTVAGPLALILAMDRGFAIGAVETTASGLLAGAGWLIGLSLFQHPIQSELRLAFDQNARPGEPCVAGRDSLETRTSMSGFDVAIPNYNYARYLGDCVRSVLAQDVHPLRVLIIDNASTDDSLAVARDLASQDSRVDVRAHRTNLGSRASFNAAIDWAREDYFQIVCSDDMLVPGALRRAGEVLDGDPSLAFCCGRDVAIGENDGPPALNISAEPARWRHIPGRAFIEDACRRGAMDTPTAALVMRTMRLKRVGHFRELQFEDHEFWLRFAVVGDFAQLDNVQAAIRYHGSNMELRLAPTHLGKIVHITEAVESFFSHEGASIPDGARLHRLARRGLGDRAYWAALAAWARGGESGRDLMAYAIGRRPFSVVAPPFGYLFARRDAANRAAVALRALIGRR